MRGRERKSDKKNSRQIEFVNNNKYNKCFWLNMCCMRYTFISLLHGYSCLDFNMLARSVFNSMYLLSVYTSEEREKKATREECYNYSVRNCFLQFLYTQRRYTSTWSVTTATTTRDKMRNAFFFIGFISYEYVCVFFFLLLWFHFFTFSWLKRDIKFIVCEHIKKFLVNGNW